MVTCIVYGAEKKTRQINKYWRNICSVLTCCGKGAANQCLPDLGPLPSPLYPANLAQCEPLFLSWPLSGATI